MQKPITPTLPVQSPRSSTKRRVASMSSKACPLRVTIDRNVWRTHRSIPPRE